MRPIPVDLDAMLRRLHLPTVRRLYMELADRAEKEEMSFRDFLATLVSEEVAHRGQTRIERSVRKARFPFLATIEEFSFAFQTSLRLSMLGSYLAPEFVSEGRCALFLGPTGLGKTHLAIAIAYRAIQNGYEARFALANEMLESLSLAAQEGRLRHALSEYVEPDVLVIDEVGYLTHRPDAANVLYHVVNLRHHLRRPMLLTTNKPTAAWGQVLHDGDLAEAILDRVLERGRIFELRGRSYRTRHLEDELRPGRGEAALQSQAETRPAPQREEGGRRRIPGIDGAEFPEPTALTCEAAVPASTTAYRLAEVRNGVECCGFSQSMLSAPTPLGRVYDAIAWRSVFRWVPDFR
jgi:DNA replication protein DnaC